MDKFVVEGGRPLEGSVSVCGSKNAVLPVMAAGLLTDQPLVIRNAPLLSDVDTMMHVLRDLECQAERNADGSIAVRALEAPKAHADWQHVRRMRGSVTVLGPLLARAGRAEVSLPGGCVIGVRPIDVHLKGFEALGARVKIERGYVVAEAPRGGLRGARVYLGTSFGSSVTGTENVMMAAALAKGRTVIDNAACEPEVVDLGMCLEAMGAKIKGLGSPRIEIEGVAHLSGVTWSVIPDRIEAGTYVIAGAMCGGRVRVEGARPDHLSALLDRMQTARIPFTMGEDWIETQPWHPRDPVHRPMSTDVTTLPYPGFPTDLQAQWMALMTLADGLSVITETIYPDRYMHIAELARLGAQVRRQGTSAVVQGTPKLSGAPVTASDLRASAALVLGALVAEGTTEIHRVYHIDRGYERIEERLAGLGAMIRREDEKVLVEAGAEHAGMA
ncbi:MAG TPA: UDP-N-acetylglucosamine 1-carboxyvinyltransferase [Planctomycetota bacterium]|nr:UDP-N-acetylglucosamine 1-carboxyvinyltransferase [Planctomycetota bacterium]